MSNGVALVGGSAGIYAAFLYYGSLQEDVLTFKNPETGEVFKYAWFLQIMESVANVVAGLIGMFALEGGFRPGVPQQPYLISGACQVSAKYFTTAAMVYGVSFPVAMLAKSAKMVPVMIGQILFGSAKYSMREYAHVAAIVGGTVFVSTGKKSEGGAPSSTVGLILLAVSLCCDGAVGGVQKGAKKALKDKNMKEQNFEMQFLTNFYMFLTACVFTAAFGEFGPALAFLSNNPSIMWAVCKFGLCSAFGQAFIFYVIKSFDPLVCTTVTTTRKVFSVMWSILTKGHKLSAMGWGGMVLACAGILGELEEKFTKSQGHGAPKVKTEEIPCGEYSAAASQTVVTNCVTNCKTGP